MARKQEMEYVVVTTCFQWRIAFTALSLGCFAPSGLVSKVRNTPLKACSKWFTKIAVMKMRG